MWIHVILDWYVCGKYLNYHSFTQLNGSVFYRRGIDPVDQTYNNKAVQKQTE